MGDWDASEADALSRLEAALDRIAKHKSRPARDDAAEAETAIVAGRLDKLIGQLRHALATEA